MFTAAEFRLICEDCPEKLDSLLENLGIKKPAWNKDDEFKIYADLDDEIINKLCERMNSDSIIDGYTKLMTLGDLHFDYSETDNELLATILKEQEKIQERLKEKIIESKKISALPPADEPVESDYSDVEIVFSRADFEFGISKLVLKNREKLKFHQDLATQIKNLVCDCLRKEGNYNVVKAIEISVKTENVTYRPKFSTSQKNTAQPEKPPFTQNEFSEVVKSLSLVEDIIKSI